MTFAMFLYLIFGKTISFDDWSIYFIGAMAIDAFILGMVLLRYLNNGGTL